jgi:hypothetical protein
MGMCKETAGLVLAACMAGMVLQGKMQRMSQPGCLGGEQNQPKDCERAVPHAILSL